MDEAVAKMPLPFQSLLQSNVSYEASGLLVVTHNHWRSRGHSCFGQAAFFWSIAYAERPKVCMAPAGGGGSYWILMSGLG